MEKSRVYVSNKRALIATILLIVILFSASYAYFTSYNNANATYSVGIDNGLNITYLLTAGSQLNLTVNPSQLGDGGLEYVESSVANDVVTLDNASEYVNLMCNYEIWYEPTTAFANSSTNTEGLTEFALIGTDSSGQNSGFTYDLGGVNTATKVYSGSIITSASALNITQTWNFTLRHYNLDLNQNEQMGKSFGGKVYFKAGGCKKPTLSDAVLALADGSERQSSQTNGGVYRVINPEVSVPSPTTYTKLTQSEYGNVTEYQGTGTSTLPSAGTTLSEIMFDYNSSDNTYSNDVTNMATSSYYHMVVPVEENASYQICYKVTTAGATNYLYAYITDEKSSYIGYEKLSKQLNSVGTTYTCTDLGYLTEGQGIRIINRTYTTKAAVTFYLQKSTEMTSNGNAGVRYQGKAPNNYVQFNGTELWRIIGVFEGSTIGKESGKYYTKIIKNDKNESIGNKYWDESGLNNWANASLNTYLTNTYLAGIDTNSSDMIAQDVTYYLGGAPDAAYTTYTPAQFYQAERGNTGGAAAPTVVTHQNEIGLMYPSDYGYAMYAGSSNNVCNTDLVIYNYSTSYLKCANYDWMFFNTNEWTISPDADYSDRAFRVHGSDGGYVGRGGVSSGHAVRPVLYLEASVEIESGEGTASLPYILK